MFEKNNLLHAYIPRNFFGQFNFPKVIKVELFINHRDDDSVEKICFLLSYLEILRRGYYILEWCVKMFSNLHKCFIQTSFYRASTRQSIMIRRCLVNETLKRGRLNNQRQRFD